MTDPVQIGSITKASLLTTILSGVLNLIMLLYVCFVLMPRVDNVSQAAMQVRDEMEVTRKLLDERQKANEKSWREVEFHRAVLERLTDSVGVMEASRKKSLEKKNNP